MNILAAILLFGFIVLIHEFGHFLFAKLNGICVVEFSIGMGPRLISFEKGETRYSLKILPFGGSCMMLGEDDAQSDPRAFNNKSVWARISVIAAGPVFNFILAFLFAMVIVSHIGHDSAVLQDVMEGYPAAEAGLQTGDKIVKIDNRKVTANRDISLYLFSHPGKPVTIQYEREGSGRQSVTIQPQYAQEYGSYMIGVQFPGYEKITSPVSLLYYSAYEVKYCIVSTFDSLGMMFRQQVQVDEAVAGPVRIVTMVGETVGEGREAGASAVIMIISYWILILSASLGIMNLLPIPALDGGRLVFLILELLRGKPIDQQKEGMVHLAGMMVLMAIMVLILFNDIRNLL
ncbi:MAG: RIP metalloprotease RseP [Lachnospiraceae bacterium]